MTAGGGNFIGWFLKRYRETAAVTLFRQYRLRKRCPEGADEVETNAIHPPKGTNKVPAKDMNNEMIIMLLRPIDESGDILPVLSSAIFAAGKVPAPCS